MVALVEQVLLYKLYPTIAGFKAVMRRQGQTKYMQVLKYSYKTSSCNAVLLIHCCNYPPVCTKNNTTDVSPAIPLLLFMHPCSNSGAENRVSPPLNLTAGYVTASARLYDHRRITCYLPAFRYHHLVLITPKQF